jgi:ATP-dependent Clp protease ATP-binding subunit ClpX
MSESKRETSDRQRPSNAWCSFCRKSHTEVGPLVEGPDEVYICYPCVRLCASIIEEECRRLGVAPKE